jgi:hypothetical protein
MSRRGRESRLSSLARFPISWPAATVRKGHDLNAVIHDPADQLEGKPMKEITASAVHKQRPAFRSKRDGFDAAVKFGQKRIRSRLASGLIPLPSSLGFLNGGGMKNIR